MANINFSAKNSTKLFCFPAAKLKNQSEKTHALSRHSTFALWDHYGKKLRNPNLSALPNYFPAGFIFRPLFRVVRLCFMQVYLF